MGGKGLVLYVCSVRVLYAIRGGRPGFPVPNSPEFPVPNSPEFPVPNSPYGLWT